MRGSWILVAVVSLCVVACGKEDASSDIECGPNGTCPAGYTCDPVSNHCFKTGTGGIDAAIDARSDASLPDAPPPDASPPDAPPIDAPPPPPIDAALPPPDDAAIPIDARPPSPDAPEPLIDAAEPDGPPPDAEPDAPPLPGTVVITGGLTGSGAIKVACSEVTFTYDTDPPAASFECGLVSGSGPVGAKAFDACPSSGQMYSGLAGGQTYTFAVRAIDELGQAGVATSRTFVVDGTGPAIVISEPAGVTTVTFAVAFTETPVTATSYQCQVDDGDPVLDCMSGHMFVDQPSGRHTVRVSGADACGNVGSDESDIIVVSPTSVLVTAPGDGDSTGEIGDITYVVGTSASVECTLDTVEVACDLAGPVPYSLAAGTHAFTITGFDALENVVGSDAITWTVVGTGPTVTPVVAADANANPDGFPEGAIVTCPDVTASLTCEPLDANDCPAKTLACELDGDSRDCSSGELALTGLAQGEHTLTAMGTDSFDHEGAIGSVTFHVDATPPAVTFDDPPIYLCSGTGSIAWSTGTGDEGSTFDCVIDDTPESCAGSATGGAFEGLGDGEHTVTVTATDACENGHEVQGTFIVTTTAPVAGAVVVPSINGTDVAVSFSVTATSDPTPIITCTLTDPALVETSVPCVPDTDNELVLADTGDYTFTVTASDHCGNEDTSSATFYVDANAPDIGSLSCVVPAITGICTPWTPTTGSRTCTFTATDGDSSFACACALNETPVACSTGVPHAFTGLAPDSYTYTVTCTDVNGNESQESVAFKETTPGDPCSFDLVVDAANGDDEGAGDCTEPKKTITAALDAAGSGAWIKVLPGTYDAALGESFPLTVPAGVKLIGDEAVVGAGTTIDSSLVVATSAVALLDGNPGAVLGGLTITGSMDKTALLKTGQFSIIQHNTITGNAVGTGVLVQGGSQSVCGNVLSGNGTGIEFPDSSGTGLYFQNKVFSNGLGIVISNHNASQGNWGNGSAACTDMSKGHNIIACNSSFDIFNGSGKGMSAKCNSWDAPLTVSCQPGGDICNSPDTGSVDTAGADATIECP